MVSRKWGSLTSFSILELEDIISISPEFDQEMRIWQRQQTE